MEKTYRVEVVLGKKKIAYWTNMEAYSASDIRKAIKINVIKIKNA